jgi:hypothetical protein
MLTELTQYYNFKKISAINFDCPHYRKVCSKGCNNFTCAQEAYVGSEYENGELPRILFLSSDPGWPRPNPIGRTLSSLRNELQGANIPSKGHWHETYEMALMILSSFNKQFTIDSISPYFAHTNSAKCCQNKKGGKQADDILFEYCKEFIPGELSILLPNILITQGDKARQAVNGAFKVIYEQEGLCDYKIIELTNEHRTLWFQSYHPSNFGRYWPQKKQCWSLFKNIAESFINGKLR